MDQQATIVSAIDAVGTASMSDLLSATGLTRPGVLYHLNKLIDAGEVEHASRQTRGRSVRYRLAYDNRWDFSIEKVDSEHRLWQQLSSSILHPKMSRAAVDIHAYVFGEMVNNVIEHSESADLVILHRNRDRTAGITVRDTGVGIFDHIAATEGFDDKLASVRRLQSGAYTTAPAGHTGQGVFFSSRAVDRFSVNSGGIIWSTDNLIPDQTLQILPTTGRGTSVTWQLQDHTNRSLFALFETFSIRDEEGVPQFAVTTVAVAIAGAGSEFVTRSIARELLEGKAHFERIVLDFAGVTHIGQGFADEAFRVFPTANPGVTISAVNMNEAVSWFVERAQADIQRDYRS
jgi:anti-sigma regulatory factor (Ser/Thr protein kinase)/uncharacterized protein (DUF1330 family)